MFLIDYATESTRCVGRVQGVLCKNVSLADLLRQYLVQILETSLTVKSKGKYSKNWMFQKMFAMEGAKFFLE